MGRKYYCDYCQKQIPPGLNHRKSHNRTVQHINNKRLYYLQFKDSHEILLEERSKRMCNKWIQTGSCPFENNCKYSHRPNYELIQLIQKENPSFNNQSFNFDIQKWIRNKTGNIPVLPVSLC